MYFKDQMLMNLSNHWMISLPYRYKREIKNIKRCNFSQEKNKQIFSKLLKILLIRILQFLAFAKIKCWAIARIVKEIKNKICKNNLALGYKIVFVMARSWAIQ